MFDTTGSQGSSGRQSRASNALVGIGAGLLIVGTLVLGPSLAPYISSWLYPLPVLHVSNPALSITPPPLADSPSTSSLSLLPLFVEAGELDGVTEPAESLESEPIETEPVESVEVQPAISTPTPQPLLPPPPAGYAPTRIVIPSIGIDAEVVKTDWEMVDVGGILHPVWIVPDAHLAGWHNESAALDVPGNTVINAHNWPQHAIFRDLYMVEPGEQITIYSNNRPFIYEIKEVLLLPEAGQPLEVRQANARYIQPTDDERVTLITCHPYGQTTYRLVVTLRPFIQNRPIVDEP